MASSTKTDTDCKFCSFARMKELKIEPCNQKAFQVYCGYFHFHEEEPSKDDFDDCYQGEYKSVDEFCEELFSGCDDSYNALNPVLKICIDWKEVWEYSIKYDYTFEKGYVFNLI